MFPGIAFRPSAAHIVLVGVFLLYLLAGTAFNAIVPLGEAPDEPSHLNYVRYVAEHGSLPVMKPRYADNETVEAFQPPLYYLLAAFSARFAFRGELNLLRNPSFRLDSPFPAYLPLPEHRFPWRGSYLAWHLIRFLSLGLGALSLGVTYCAGLLVFERRWLALSAVAYLALNPQFIYLHSSVTNDALASLIGGLITLLALILLKRPALLGFAAAGLVVVLAVLSKPSALTLLPSLLLALIVAWRALPSRRVRWTALGLLMLTPVLGTGWWFWRNLQLYGDLLGMSVAKQALAPNYYPQPLSLSQLVAALPPMLTQTLKSSWGIFGWLVIPLPDAVFTVILLLHVPALFGLLAQSRTVSSRNLVPFVLFSGWLGLIIGFLFYAREVNSSGWHGRLLFPGATVLAIGFVAGWRYWFRQRESALAVFTTVGGVVLMGYALFGTIFPLYLTPRSLPPDEPVPNPIDLRFSDGLQLVGYDVKPDVAAPGSSLQVVLYWKLQHKIQNDYRFFVGGHTIHGVPVVSTLESNLTRRFPVALWPENEVFADRYQLRASDDLNQVVGDLFLEVFEGRDNPQAVPYVDANGHPIGDKLVLGPVVLRSGTRSQGSSDSVLARFANGEMVLSGYDLSPTFVRPGAVLSVTLHWQATQAPGQNYHVFVHLLDEQGQLIAQHDGPPRLGAYPTFAWSSHETVTDVHPVQIPPDFQGDVRILLGLYVLDSLERLPVSDSSGTDYPDRALPLATIHVDR